MKEQRSKELIIPLEIYSDGSCKKQASQTFGGWAFIAVRNSQEIFNMSGSQEGTTNQRMELLAIRNALLYAASARKENEKVIIYSDSAYAINCYIQNWYKNWEINGWVNSKKEPVANQDLWIEIIPFFNNFWYDFQKIKGHDGNYWNERCDDLAQTSAAKLKIEWRGKNND